MGFVIMKGSLQKVGKRNEAGTGTEIRIGREARTGIGTEKGTEIRIVIVTVEIGTVIVIAIEIVVREGSGAEKEMTMIFSEAEIMIGHRISFFVSYYI